MLHIYTLSWQGKDKLCKLKDSLIPAMNGLQWIWHIKENGSTDGSVEAIKEWNLPNINLIAYPHNRNNYSEGINLLFKESSAKNDDLVLTLNNDIIIRDTTSIKNMIDILIKDQEVGIVGAKLNYTDSDTIQHCGVLFHKSNGLPFHYRGGLKESERDQANRYYPVVTGAISLMKADTFANAYTKNNSGQVGFREDFIFAFEDVDMCMRVHHHLKKKNVYCGNTSIWHEESATLKKNPIHKMFFKDNCKLFMDPWYKYIDVNLVDKYTNNAYALYKP